MSSSRYHLAWHIYLLALVYFIVTRCLLLFVAMKAGTAISITQALHIEGLGYYNKEGLSVLGPSKAARKFTFNPDGSVDKVVENAAGPHTEIAKAYYEGA